MNHIPEIGKEVIRTKGDYVAGRKGRVIDYNDQNNRVQVKWYIHPKTWVSIKVIELTEPEKQ